MHFGFTCDAVGCRDISAAHSPVHLQECDSKLLDPLWRPGWDVDNREPDDIRAPIGYGGYPWGNTQPFNILQLEQNEGIEYDRSLDLLFAACEDLRNVMMTVIGIPADYPAKITITINDQPLNNVARIIIILRYLFDQNYGSRIVDDIIHFWYSACIPATMHQYMSETLLGEVEREVENQSHSLKKQDRPITVLWGRGKLKVTLKKSEWVNFKLHIANAVAMDDLEETQEARIDAVASPDSLDLRETFLFRQPAPCRLSFEKWRKDGMLFPFGWTIPKSFRPNATLFCLEDGKLKWLPHAASRPDYGWSRAEFMKADTSAATNDIFAKLYTYIHSIITKFHKQITVLNVEFDVVHSTLSELPRFLGDLCGYYKGLPTFNRIETSNLADPMNFGTVPTINMFSTLLNQSNPHATLIISFLHIAENPSEALLENEQDRHNADDLLSTFFPSSSDREFDAVDRMRKTYNFLFQDFERTFGESFQKLLALGNDINIHISVKYAHSIIDPWPNHVKKRGVEEPGTFEEFANHVNEGRWPGLRYVELQILPPP
ncbi:hypothetical protein F4677DRAFT_450561 [Hypoxylon crocopeplum]|nr:hypothetical protein F4677DRAFT_450561 [Hypoxylon crocopeplum]